MQFTRDPSGLYLATDRADARVAFLFQRADQTPPTFDLTAQTWQPLPGFIAFFAPSTTRDWNTFATNLRNAFTQRQGSRLGWFPEPVAVQSATFVSVGVQGAPPPKLTASFSLRFSGTMTCNVAYSRTGLTTVAFDDSTNSIVISQPPSVQPPLVQLQVTPAGGGQQIPFSALGPMRLPLAGSFAGCAQVDFPASSKIDENALQLFEAGVVFFSQKPSELVTALRYPTFRAPVGTSGPFYFSFKLFLDVLTPTVLTPTDEPRTFFKFADARLGSYFATSMGKPLALGMVDGAAIENWSRLVFAVRPVQGPTDRSYYYDVVCGAIPR